MSNREAAIAALASLLESAYSWAVSPSRKLKLWSDVPLNERPALFIFEGGQERYTYNNVNCKRTLNIKLFIYTNAKDDVGSIELNNILDALDIALSPNGADLTIGRNTLGGAVFYCRIEGDVFKDPGDLDGEGLLIVPLQILFP